MTSRPASIRALPWYSGVILTVPAEVAKTWVRAAMGAAAHAEDGVIHAIAKIEQARVSTIFMRPLGDPEILVPSLLSALYALLSTLYSLPKERWVAQPLRPKIESAAPYIFTSSRLHIFTSSRLHIFQENPSTDGTARPPALPYPCITCRLPLTISFAPVAFCTSSAVNRGATSSSTIPFGVTRMYPISVTIVSTTPTPVSGSVHFSRIFGAPDFVQCSMAITTR